MAQLVMAMRQGEDEFLYSKLIPREKIHPNLHTQI